MIEISRLQAVADHLPAIALAQRRLLSQVKTSAQARREDLDSGLPATGTVFTGVTTFYDAV